jgi:hypothetical protein
MGLITSLKELTPTTRAKAEAFLDKCHEENVNVFFNETRRDIVTQLVYFLQGRIDPLDSNKDIVNEYNRLRKKLGFWDISTSDALNKKITWTLESNHEYGTAFDVVPLKDGRAWWSAPIEVWTKIGEIGESVGLKWGGRWEGKKQDLPHFEL